MKELPRLPADPRDLTSQMLLWAYRHGIFPMADPESGRIDWYCPPTRGVIPLEGFRASISLRRVVRARIFEIRMDSCFSDVISACAEPRRDDPSTWISADLQEAYCRLFRSGSAHSVEAWREGALVGGLYGVHIGGAFFGESMFSRPDIGGTNASKVCLVRLVEHLRSRGFVLLDTQFWNPHLDQFGCLEVPAAEYASHLAAAVELPVTWQD